MSTAASLSLPFNLKNSSAHSASRSSNSQSPHSISEHDFPNTTKTLADVVIPNTSSVGVIEATVGALKEDVLQFFERYREAKPLENDDYVFVPTSMRPNSVRKVELDVRKTGPGKLTVAFDLEDLYDDE